jgi:hypothetical protein
MQEDIVCFPAPLGCFTLPTGRDSSSVQDSSEGEDYAGEFILSDGSLAESLREQAPPGCFLCLVDTLDEED